MFDVSRVIGDNDTLNRNSRITKEIVAKPPPSPWSHFHPGTSLIHSGSMNADQVPIVHHRRRFTPGGDAASANNARKHRIYAVTHRTLKERTLKNR